MDGMALVQKVSVESIQITFGRMASSLVAMVLREGLDSSRINFVSAPIRKIPLIMKEACEGRCLECKK